MEIAGKVALVTGVSRGVGRAVAVALAQAGADVACAARATDGTPLPLPGTIDETVRAEPRRTRMTTKNTKGSCPTDAFVLFVVLGVLRGSEPRFTGSAIHCRKTRFDPADWRGERRREE